MAEENVYQIKRIQHFGRKQVPIVMQNENGPCPLLGIANVLLLRNAISIMPESTVDISASRLLSLVVERLLDSNASTEGKSEQYVQNQQQNLSDAMSAVPKLATGIDVNVKYGSVFDFEFTPETSLFDLLDISLVHGWLVDPQDTATVSAIGPQSYNHLVERVLAHPEAVAALQSDPQAQGQSRESASLRKIAEGLASLPREAGAGAVPAAEPSKPRDGPSPGEPRVLDSSVGESADAAATSAPGEEDRGISLEPGRADQSAGFCVEPSSGMPMASDPKEEASPLAEKTADEAQAETETGSDGECPVKGSQGGDMGLVHVGAQMSVEERGGEGESGGREGRSEGAALQQPRDELAESATVTTETEIVTGHSTDEEGPQEESTSPKITALSKQTNPTCSLAQGSSASPPTEREIVSGEASGEREGLREALLIASFLAESASQLTYHGLFCLQEKIKEQELCVFFRNNHFSTLFKHEGQLFLLVTDQGYLNQPAVVWEKLGEVEGDNQFFSGDFSPFVGARDAEALPDAQWFQEDDAAIARAIAADMDGITDVRGPLQGEQESSDHELALALQQQEEEGARRNATQHRADAATLSRVPGQPQGAPKPSSPAPPAGAAAGSAPSLLSGAASWFGGASGAVGAGAGAAAGAAGGKPSSQIKTGGHGWEHGRRAPKGPHAKGKGKGDQNQDCSVM